MSRGIIAAIRTQKQLTGNRFLIALELAALMNDQGRKRVSYAYLAAKAHCCKRTAMSAMHDLVAAHIFQRQRQYGTFGEEINLYICTVPVPPGFRVPPGTTRGANPASTLPNRRQREEPDPSLQEDIRRQQWALHNMPMPPEAREACRDELARLEALAPRSTP